MQVKRSFTKELLWIYAVGLAGMLIPVTRPWFKLITPINLLVVAGLLFYSHSGWNVRTVVSLTLVGLLSFFIEALGVNTGLIFGEYKYGPTLGPAVINTPLMIGVNWIVLVYACHSVAASLFGKLPGSTLPARAFTNAPALMTALLGGLLMVLYDFVLEPSAIALEMWSWSGTSVPVQNYVAWFLLSFSFILFIGLNRVNTRNINAMPVYLIQLLFFALIDIWVFFGRLI
ncbi:MAG: carotenoid biosynthesis protein [Bacteroidetes bacterium]|nr:carotenoid biosynthesis protein [Bacteroidota bacterium]